MKRTIILILPTFIIFTILFFVLSQKGCDWAMSFQAKKDIPFNHKAHLTDYQAGSCDACHGFYSDGRFKGIPTVGDCKMCHDGNTAEEKEAFKNYQDTDKPWEAYAKQPALVYFSHKVVNDSPKTTRCSSCHGDKENSTTTEKIKGKMLMGQCMDCHTALSLSNKCTICHK